MSQPSRYGVGGDGSVGPADTETARILGLAREHVERQRGLDQLEYFCKGTVLKRMTKCGKAYCACASNPTKRHGPYFELTYKVEVPSSYDLGNL